VNRGAKRLDEGYWEEEEFRVEKSEGLDCGEEEKGEGEEGWYEGLWKVKKVIDGKIEYTIINQTAPPYI
jgi:hypothetical protein